jgi:circadian clock protein KaiC
MTTVLSEKGVTLLMTNELEACPNEQRFSPVGSAFLVDAIVTQRFIEADAELHTVIAVIKVRGSSHSRQLRKFRITADGMDIDAGPAPFKNMLRLGDGSSR